MASWNDFSWNDDEEEERADRVDAVPGPLAEVVRRLLDGSVYDVVVHAMHDPRYVTIGQVEGVVIAYCGCPAFKFSAEFPKTCKHV